MCSFGQSQYSHLPVAITYALRHKFAAACARIKSPRLLVRIIQKLNNTPARKPTSQYGPCSLANRNATTQKEVAVYDPSATFWKFGAIIQRSSQPRQNSSSTIGTRTEARKVRRSST